jgi:hypothetical protein
MSEPSKPGNVSPLPKPPMVPKPESEEIAPGLVAPQVARGRSDLIVAPDANAEKSSAKAKGKKR